MIETVNRISRNPLRAVQEEENIQLALQEFGEQHNTQKRNNMETKVLEQTLIKIGGLLAIGLGEAGSEIITQNMQ
jgi:hypothetical protein